MTSKTVRERNVLGKPGVCAGTGNVEKAENLLST